MEFLKEKKQVFLLVALIILLLGLAAFLIYKFYHSEKYQDYEPIRIIHAQEAKENFDSVIRGTALSGKFLSFDEDKSEIYVSSFNTSTKKVITHSFKVDEQTIFSEMTFEFDESKLFPKEDLKEIPRSTQVLIYYSYLENQPEVLIAKMIQIENPSQQLLSPPLPSPF